MKTADPMKLHRTVWECVDQYLDMRLTRQADREVLFFYCKPEASDRYDEGSWTASSSELSYDFGDAAGCCTVSSQAALHWLQLCLAMKLDDLDLLASQHGYRITSPRTTVKKLLKERSEGPFVAIGKTLFQVSSSAEPDDDTVILQSDSQTRTLDELTPRQREKVQRVIDAGQCACQLCEYGRKRKWTSKKPAKKTFKSLAEALICHKTAESLTIVSQDEWDRLSDRLGELRNLEQLELVDIAADKLPPAVATLDNLRRLKILHGDIRSLPPELATMENLRRLDISSDESQVLVSRAIFDAFPSIWLNMRLHMVITVNADGTCQVAGEDAATMEDIERSMAECANIDDKAGFRVLTGDRTKITVTAPSRRRAPIPRLRKLAKEHRFEVEVHTP